MSSSITYGPSPGVAAPHHRKRKLHSSSSLAAAADGSETDTPKERICVLTADGTGLLKRHCLQFPTPLYDERSRGRRPGAGVLPVHLADGSVPHIPRMNFVGKIGRQMRSEAVQQLQWYQRPQGDDPQVELGLLSAHAGGQIRQWKCVQRNPEEAMQDDDDDNDDEGDGQAGKRANGKSAGEKTGGAPDQLIDDCELERVWKIPLTDPKTDRIIGLEWLEPSLCGHLNSFGGKAEEENRRKTRSQTQEAEDERNTVVSGWGGLLAARASDGAVFFLDARNQFSFDTEDPFEEKLEDAGDNEEDEDDKDDENDDEGREGETEDGSDDEESGQAEEEAAERRRAKKQPESGARSSSSSASAMSQLQPLFKTAPDAERMRLHPKTLRLGTTGKEHPVRIYDLTKPEEPIWIAKNIKHHYLNLRHPIWNKDFRFASENPNIIMTGSAYHSVSLYDLRQYRRPVLHLEKLSEVAITAVDLTPNGTFGVAGDAAGALRQLDFRKGKRAQIGIFRGGAGAIRSVELTQNTAKPLVISCGIDRYLRVHSFTTRALLQRLYLKQQLTSLAILPFCFHRDFDQSSSGQDGQQQESAAEKKKKKKRRLAKNDEEEISDEDVSSSEEDEDELWGELERNKQARGETKKGKAGKKAKQQR